VSPLCRASDRAPRGWPTRQQNRDLLAYYGLWEKHRILYGGLVELMVNAMADVQPGFIQWEWR
jgi:hypothetical protein